MAKRICEFLVAFGLVLVLSCKYDPHPRSGAQACASGPKQCPNGYVCSGGLCRIPTDIIPDASGPAPDAPQIVDGPGVTGSDTTTTTRTATNTGTACGITGRPCCANKACPGAGTICNAEGNCVVCGSSGYVCCAGNTCLGIGTTCSAGNCVPCGASGQPCCAGNLCGATLACIGVTCQPPNPDGGVSTSTGTTTARDAGIDASTTGTLTLTATGTPIVRDAGNDAATATSTVTGTATKTKGDAGNDASTSTSTATFRTFPGTGIITSTSISTGTGTGVLPLTGLTTSTHSTH